MSPDIINVGASPNDGQGDPIRTAFIKTNSNFAELFALPNPTPPTTLVGSAGDVPGMYAYNSSYFYYCFATWNGSSVIWAQVSQINSVSVNKINNGTSNVSIAGANANVTITVNSISNIATFSTIGLSVNGNITGNYFIGNGSQLTGIIANYGNANVSSFLPTYSGNLGAITAVGNVTTVSFFVGDGSQLSNITAANIVGAYSNANVANYLPTFSGNITGGNILITGITSVSGNILGGNINTVGNVTANYFSGDGSQLTNLPAQPGTYGNANVAAYLPTYTGNITANIISTTGNVSASTFVGSGQYLNLSTMLPTSNIGGSGVGASIGNINLAGNITFTPYLGSINWSGGASHMDFTQYGHVDIVGSGLNVYGNITAATGNYFIGDGSLLTNLPAGNYGNANVAAYLPTYTGNITANVISATGNVYTDGYFVGNFSGNISGNLIVPGANTQVLYNNNCNAGASAGLTFDSASNVLASTGNISTTGNVIAVAMYTSSVVSAGGNVRGSNFNTTGIVSATGNVTGGNITTSGALTISGSSSYIDVAGTGFIQNGGTGEFEISSTAGRPVWIYTNGGGNRWTFGIDGSLSAVAGNISTAGNVTANYFIGNISGSVANAVYATTAGSSNTAATVTSNAQPNITSVGTLTSLSVTGNVTANNIIANSFVTSNGFFKLPSYTTVQISALTGMTGGEMVYDTDLQIVQAYQLNPATSTMGWVSWTVAVYQ